jgi:hypothetical protein
MRAVVEQKKRWGVSKTKAAMYRFSPTSYRSPAKRQGRRGVQFGIVTKCRASDGKPSFS